MNDNYFKITYMRDLTNNINEEITQLYYQTSLKIYNKLRKIIFLFVNFIYNWEELFKIKEINIPSFLQPLST